MKQLLLLTTLSLWSWSGLHLAMLHVNAEAKSPQSISQFSLKQFFLPPPPPTGTPSGRSQGGGSRGDCQPNEELPPLTALVPSSALSSEQDNAVLPELEYVWSYTTKGHPTLWFYTPYELDAETEVLFVLQDKERNTLESYSQSFRPASSPGIIGVTLPESAPPLAVGEGYYWSFQIYCDESPDFVEGWIYRVNPEASLERQLAMAKPQEQARLYAVNGIWQDALTRLARLHQAAPDNAEVTEDWQDLLESAGLEAVVGQPFSECCSLTE